MTCEYTEVTSEYDRSQGGERWLRNIDEKCWVSVLYRLTGFGWYEWETAIVFVHEVPAPTWKDRDVLIIAGDRREELATVAKDDLRAWYAANIDGNKISMDVVLDAMKKIAGA